MSDAEPAAPRPRTDASRGTSDGLVLVAIVATVILFLCVAGYPRQWSQGLRINDEFWYAQLTRNLYEGNGYVSSVIYPIQARDVDGFPVPPPMKQPGMQLVTAAVWLLTGESVHAMLAVALAGMALFAAGIYLLARHLGWSPGASAFVVGATIAHPVMAQYGFQALPESLYYACFTFTVLFLLRGGTGDLIVAGALNAALMLIKGHGLIYIPVFAAFLWLRNAPSLRAALRPSGAKLRAVGTYLGAGLSALLILWAVLPSGSVQIFEAGGTYSNGALIEVGRRTSELPYLSVDPPDVWTYISQHPGQYLGKVARMVKRTKMMCDALAGPALGGILFPALMLSFLLLGANALRPGRFLSGDRPRAEPEPYLLFAACIGWALLAFWPLFMTARLFMHLLPCMLLLCMYVGSRIVPARENANLALRGLLAAAAVAYFIGFPATATLWDSYREPDKLLGSMLAVRHLDYRQMAANVESDLPADAVVVSDMPHEIVWLTRRNAIAFPNGEEDLEYLIDKFDVDAIYEHPLLRRDWPLILREFRLVDDENGFLWVRRRDGDRSGAGANG